MTIGKTNLNLISYLSLCPTPSLNIKDLGINYNNRLKINTLSKCSRTNMPIYFILRFVKCTTLRLLVYRAKILPHLDMSAPLTINISAKDISPYHLRRPTVERNYFSGAYIKLNEFYNFSDCKNILKTVVDYIRSKLDYSVSLLNQNILY